MKETATSAKHVIINSKVLYALKKYNVDYHQPLRVIQLQNGR